MPGIGGRKMEYGQAIMMCVALAREKNTGLKNQTR